MKNFFLSLKTTVWTLFALVCLFFVGSYLMPAHREIFASMNETILFAWLENAAWGSPWYTWWFFAALAALALLAVNTLFCGIQAVKGGWTRADFLQRIAPQVVHAGFLFILLAHLLGAGWGYKLSGSLPEGAYARLPEERTLYLKQLRVQADARGVLTDWAAEVLLYENKELVAAGALGPNQPLFYRGTGIYLKSLSLETGPTAFLVVAKDPGALWALAGGVLGSAALLAPRWNRPAS
jgi:hypothetical protein